MEQESTVSFDDLPAPLNEMPRLGGPGPFVINLASAGAPIPLPRDLAAFTGTKLYQLQRTEDRRIRYRLRLGPFGVEDAADAALCRVRELYPCALTATASEDDLRIIAHLLPTPAVEPSPPVERTLAAAPMDLIEEMQFGELSLVDDEQPKPVTDSNPSVPAVAAASFETTQTIRPLTELDLVDDQQEPCYVIQLSEAAQAFNPYELPSLDIFSCYRLYSVAGGARGPFAHALRLGFFSTEIAARAVQSYIAAHYPAARIERVSHAERERFEGQESVEARMDVGATGVHAVIEITGDRLPRARLAATGTARSEPTAAAAR